jgi:HTH-type transcriptional regulator, cell division transcriptional repressor
VFHFGIGWLMSGVAEGAVMPIVAPQAAQNFEPGRKEAAHCEQNLGWFDMEPRKQSKIKLGLALKWSILDHFIITAPYNATVVGNRAKSNEQPKNIIAQKMKEARKQAQPRVSQADLAARVEAYGVHIDRLGIGRIEAGTRTVLDFELRAIAAALYVPISWLVGEEEIYEKEQEMMRRKSPRQSFPTNEASI